MRSVQLYVSDIAQETTQPHSFYTISKTLEGNLCLNLTVNKASAVERYYNNERDILDTDELLRLTTALISKQQVNDSVRSQIYNASIYSFDPGIIESYYDCSNMLQNKTKKSTSTANEQTQSTIIQMLVNSIMKQ